MADQSSIFEDAMRRLEGAMKHTGLSDEIALRTAAYVHAIKRIGETMEAKGTRSYFSNGKAL